MRILVPRHAIDEQAAPRREYYAAAYWSSDSVLDHVSYLLLYADGQNDAHWKQELFSMAAGLKQIEMKGGNKAKVTRGALIDAAHGEDFAEDIADPQPLFEEVYESEDQPRDFDFDMTIKKNQDAYFDALRKFYGEFLIPWIAKTEKEPLREPFYKACDKYLIARRSELIPV